MKKFGIKKYLMGAVLSCLVFLCAGCTNGKVKQLKFLHESYAMAFNQEVAITDLVELENTNVYEIDFNSSDTSIAYISASQKIITKDKVGTAIITATGYDGFIEIVVTGSSVQFNAPTNLRFNVQTSCLEWDNVSEIGTVAKNYTVTLNNQTYYTNTNSLKIENSGSFVASVSADSCAGIVASDFSAEYSFTILESATSLAYNEETSILSWQEVQGASSYKVMVNGVVSSETNTNSIELDTSEEKTYIVSVLPCAGADNVFASPSQNITLTRLEAPSVSLSEGQLIWTQNVLGVSSYKINVYNASNQSELVKTDSIAYNMFNYKYNLQDISAGVYNVEVYAEGSKNHHSGVIYLNSKISTLDDSITKLQSLSLSYDKTSKTISVVDFAKYSGLDVDLYISNNGNTKMVDISSTGSYVCDLSVAGDYEYYLISKATDAYQINSDQSNTITVRQLDVIKGLSQNVNENGEYIIDGISLTNAKEFSIGLTYDENTTYLTSTNNIFGKADELFAKSGLYKIDVTAKGEDAENFYVMPSTTSLEIYRLEDVTLTNNSPKIEWTNQSNIQNVSYEYILSGHKTESGYKFEEEYDYSTFGAGNFTLKVKAIAPLGQKTLVLDSLNYSTIGFEINKTLTNPTIGLEREEANNAINYYLQITPITDADSYDVYVNNTYYTTIYHNTSDAISIDIKEELNKQGLGTNYLEYIVDVCAKNEQNTYYTSSELSQIKIKRMTAPSEFNLSQSEVVTVTSKLSKPNVNAEILINGYKTNKLDESNEHTIQVKFVTDSNVFDGYYYIDSDYATFTLKRVKPTIALNGSVITWGLAEGELLNPAKNIIISQEAKSKTLPVTILEGLDLSQINIEGFGFNLAKEMEGKISYASNALTTAISGNYINGHFVSDSDSNTHYISGVSAPIYVQFADADININATQEGDELSFSFNKQNGYTYSLFDGVKNAELSANTFKLNASDYILEKNYLSITKTSQDKTLTYMFTLQNIGTVQKVNVSEDETISASKISGASDVQFTYNNQVITNLQSINGQEQEVIAKYIGDKTSSTYNFVLDGRENVFKFTRLNNQSNINVSSDVLSWQNEENSDVNYTNKLKFINTESGEVYKEFKFNKNNEINLNLNDSTYRTIIDTKQNIGVAVEKIVNSYALNVGDIGYLTSSPAQKESALKLKIISAPTNVVIAADSSDMIAQDIVKIVWDLMDESKVEKYEIIVSKGNQSKTITSNGFYTVDKLNENGVFNSNGKWTVKVKAIGKDDNISSCYSAEANITRLNTVKNIVTSTTGEITWAETENASSYSIVVNYTEGGESKTVTADGITQNNYQLDQDIIKDIDSSLNVIVYAVGDGENYLSNKNETELKHLASANLTFANDKVIVNNYSDYANGTKLIATAYINGQSVLSTEMTLKSNEAGYYWEYPTTYYVDGQPINTFSTDTEIKFEIYATLNNNKTINSNISENTVIKYKDITNIRFARDVDGIINLFADCSVEAQVNLGNETQNTTGNINIKLSDDILNKIDNNWTFTFVAIGKVDAGVTYINSNPSTISGTKLVVANTARTSNGEIIWTQVSGASSYTMLVDGISTNKVYVTDLKETLSGSKYAPGEHNISIKAIGNVSTQEISTGVVLDAPYSEIKTFNKLDSNINLNIYNGYFTYVNNSTETNVVAHVYDSVDFENQTASKYSLLQTIQLEESKTLYTNNSLYESLTAGKDYFVKVRLEATVAGYLNSDFTIISNGTLTQDYITVNKMEKGALPSLYHPTTGSEVDYLQTWAGWANNGLTTTGYVINVDGNESVYSQETYVLDEKGDWMPGAHNISYRQLGSNNLDQNLFAYLTADYSEKATATKLQPVNINAYNNQVYPYETFFKADPVANANYYYSYYFTMDGNPVLYNKGNDSSAKVDFKDLHAGLYAGVGFRAVNTENNYIASDLSLYKYNDKEVGLYKIYEPRNPSIANGVMYWTLEAEELLNLASKQVIETPFFASIEEILNFTLSLKFTSKTDGSVYEFTDKLFKYIRILPEQVPALVDALKTTFGSQISDAEITAILEGLIGLGMFENGFSRPQYNFLDFASNLPSGEYTLQVMQLNDGYSISVGEKTHLVLSSKYNTGKTVYVGEAASISISSESSIYGNDYFIKFNSTTNTSYYNTEVTYDIYGIDTSGARYKLDSITVANDGNEYKYNITENLVNNLEKLQEFKDFGISLQDITQIYIVTAGNNQDVLNGKPSNLINVCFLDEVKVNAEHGEIVWTQVENACKYIVVHTSDAEVAEIYDTNTNKWIGKNLTAGTTYNVKIVAGGSDVNVYKDGLVIITGKVADIGSVTKLIQNKNTPNSVDVVYGSYMLDQYDEASGYDVLVSDSNNITYDTFVNYQFIEDNKYSPNPEDKTEKYYYFRAAGSTSKDYLNSSSVTYLNSEISAYNKGISTSGIKQVEFKNGVISWLVEDSTKCDSLKLTFTKQNENETVEVYLPSSALSYDTNIHPSLETYGYYTLTIQTCYENKTDTTGATDNISADSTIYLLSKIQEVYMFYKFDKVNNITVSGGTISWNDPETNISKQNYQFALEFTPNQGETVVKYVDSNTTQFSDVIFDNLTENLQINLAIYVVPTENADGNFVKSEYVKHKDVIYQYSLVNEDSITVNLTNSSEIIISWDPVVEEDGVQEADYELTYKYVYKDGTTTDEIIKNTNTQTNCIIENLMGIENSNVVALRFKIRTIPTKDNFMSSAWSNEQEISIPTPVTNLMYNPLNNTVSWDKYTATELEGSYQYVIIDEVYNVSGLITAKYMLFADIGVEQYQPFEIGKHKISVAVSVKGSTNTISEYMELTDVEFNLFDSGKGTAENPYLISTAKQFNNMKYMGTKLSNYNSYKQINPETNEISSIELTGNNAVYNFKQVVDLEIARTNGEDNTALYSEDDAVQFNGIYDGDYKKLTLIYNSEDNCGSVSVFSVIGTSGIVKNVWFNVNLTTNTSNKFNIYGLTETNLGTVQNVKVGDKDQEINIENTNSDITLTFISNKNYGTIVNVVNYYKVKLIVNESNSQSIVYAPFVVTNYNSLEYLSNKGSIYAKASTINVAGIVVNVGIDTQFGKNLSPVIKNSNNVADITVEKLSRNNENDSLRIGGIVANINNKLEIDYVYVKGTIKVITNSTNNQWKLGGIYGYSNQSVTIKNSLSDVAFDSVVGNAITTSTNYTAQNVYYKSGEIYKQYGNESVNFTIDEVLTSINTNGESIVKEDSGVIKHKWENTFNLNWTLPESE